jgi:CBS domain containing-hemolysin-like protein
VSVTTEAPVNEILDLARQSRFSRLLVWHAQETPRRLAGLLHLKSVLFQPQIDPQQRAEDFVRPALYLNSRLRLQEALRQMQHHRQRLAIVCSPDRRETGIISLQDILRAIFGDVSL